MKILVIKHGALGDVIRTSFFAKSLAQKYPNCFLEWVTLPNALDLLKFNPFIKKVTLVDKSGEFLPGHGLNFREYDWVLSLDDEFDSCKLVQSITYKKSSGTFPHNNSVLYTDDVAPWFDMGLLSKFGKARADQLKIRNQQSHAEIFKFIFGVETVEPNFYNDSTVEEKQKALFQTDFFHIGLNLSAGTRWPSKALSMNESLKLVKLLAALKCSKPVQVNLLGGKDDLEFNSTLASQFLTDRILTFIPPTNLAQFAAIIGSQNLVVSSDTMALHLAIAQRVPSVSYYSPTSAAEIETFGSGSKIISTAADYCSFRPNASNSTITAERIMFEAVSFLPTKH